MPLFVTGLSLGVLLGASAALWVFASFWAHTPAQLTRLRADQAGLQGPVRAPSSRLSGCLND